MVSSYELIKQAIIGRQNVAFDYGGRRREVSPHAIGAKNGRPRALCYQFGGSSRSGLEPAGDEANWRCVDVDRVSNVTLIGGRWRTAPNRSRPSTCIDAIDEQVAG